MRFCLCISFPNLGVLYVARVVSKERNEQYFLLIFSKN
jgi:hypothetical protein